MDREQKKVQIEEIRSRFEKMTSAVVTDFRGLNVDSITELRDKFRDVGVDYKVIKNTLFGIAVKDEKYGELLSKHLEGPTAVAWSYEDPAAPARVAVAFAKVNEKFKIKCAVVDGEVLEGEEVVNLSKMPGKEELLGMLLATFITPAQDFVRLLAAAPTNFVYLLDARKRKLEE